MEESCFDQHLEDDINSIDGEGDSYIEIELDTSPKCYNDDEEEEERKEYQLRISISSTISVSLDEDHHVQEECLSFHHSNVQKVDSIEAPFCDDTTMSTTYGETGEVVVINTLNHHNHYSSVGKRFDEQEGVAEVEFSVEKRDCNNTVPLFNIGVGLGLESAESHCGQTTTQRATCVSPYDKVDVLYNASARKQPKNGGMMKLLIKFRGIKMGALLASLIKPRQQHCHTNNNGHKSLSSSNKINSKAFFQSKFFFQCYHNKLTNPKIGKCNVMKRDQGIRRSYANKNWDLEDDDEKSIYGSFRSTKKSSTNNNRVVEMDLGALRGILSNAMGMSNVGQGSKSKRSSKSNSCDTTPIHEGFSLYSNSENSNIQAAIAYCKSSLGQTSDFTF